VRPALPASWDVHDVLVQMKAAVMRMSPAVIQQRPERLAAVSAMDVRAAARRYLGVASLHVVLAGDPDFLVTAQALRFGVPVRVDGLGHEM
jgi:hypothetical protein